MDIIKMYIKLYNIGLFKNMIANKIVKRNNSKLTYYFAIHLNKLDRKHEDLLTDSLIKTSKGYNLYLFAKNVKLSGNNIDKISEAIIKVGDPKIIYNYYINIMPTNNELIEMIMNSLIKLRDPEYIYLFARSFKLRSKDNIDALVTALVNTSNPHYANLFINNIKDITDDNKKKLIKTVIKYGDLYMIYDMCLFHSAYLDAEDKQVILGKIIKFNDLELVSSFAKNIPLGNLSVITHKIIESNDAKAIGLYMKEIDDISCEETELLVDKLCELKSSEYIKQVICRANLSKMNIKKLFNQLLLISYEQSYKTMDELSKIYDDISFIENEVLQTKKICLILDYIYLTKNVDLIKLLFNSTKSFYDVCVITNGTHFNINNLKDWLQEDDAFKQDFKYVDDNIEKYLLKKKN